MTKQYFEFIIGKSKDFTPEFSKIWLAPLRPVATKKTKKKLTDSSGNITWSIGVEKTSRKESAVGDKTTLMFAASKIKGILVLYEWWLFEYVSSPNLSIYRMIWFVEFKISPNFIESNVFSATIDQVLDDCEQYSTEIVDKAIYRVHQEINHITQRHLDALHLFMFSKFYLIRELSNIQVFSQKKLTSCNFYCRKNGRKWIMLLNDLTSRPIKKKCGKTSMPAAEILGWYYDHVTFITWNLFQWFPVDCRATKEWNSKRTPARTCSICCWVCWNESKQLVWYKENSK